MDARTWHFCYGFHSYTTVSADGTFRFQPGAAIRLRNNLIACYLALRLLLGMGNLCFVISAARGGHGAPRS